MSTHQHPYARVTTRSGHPPLSSTCGQILLPPHSTAGGARKAILSARHRARLCRSASCSAVSSVLTHRQLSYPRRRTSRRLTRLRAVTSSCSRACQSMTAVRRAHLSQWLMDAPRMRRGAVTLEAVRNVARIEYLARAPLKAMCMHLLHNLHGSGAILSLLFMRCRVPGRITPPAALEGLCRPAVRWEDHTNQQPTSVIMRSRTTVNARPHGQGEGLGSAYHNVSMLVLPASCSAVSLAAGRGLPPGP